MKMFSFVGFSCIAMMCVLYFGGCNYKHVELLKEQGPLFIERNGYRVTGYQGYTIGDVFFKPGGCVWYEMQRTNDEKTIYQCNVAFDHKMSICIWDLKAINAVSTQ